MDPEDYQFCLDCWLDADPDTENEEPTEQEGSDNVTNLRTRAEAIWKAGRFKVLILYRLDATADGWDEIERWE